MPAPQGGRINLLDTGPAKIHHASMPSPQLDFSPLVDSLPTSTTSLPGGSYQDPTMNSRPTSIPAQSGNSNSYLATGFYEKLASIYKTYAATVSTPHNTYETPNAEDLGTYVMGEHNYDPGPVVLFLFPAPSMHFLYYDVLQLAAVPPWPPPVLSRLAYVPVQPLVIRSTLSPHNHRISGIYSDIKPGVSYPLSEGFKGGREINDTDILSLYFRSVISYPAMEIY